MVFYVVPESHHLYNTVLDCKTELFSLPFHVMIVYLYFTV